MALNFMAKGIIIGFSIAAPVGPIAGLCIRRSLADGRQIGWAAGLGAATADAAYGCIAGFGLTAISGVLVGQRVWLGFLVVCSYAISVFAPLSVDRPSMRRRPVVVGCFRPTSPHCFSRLRIR